MQTVAAITAPVRGIVYINGRFAGECGPDSPLLMPVSPQCTLYGELRPLDPRYLPCACALKISGGQLAAESVEDGVYSVIWPGGVIEIEFAPRTAFRPESEFSSLDGAPVAILRGEASLLRVAGNSIALPAGASLPDRRISAGCEIFLGDSGEGRYMACFATGSFQPLDVILAERIEIDENAHVRTLADLKDVVGHMRIESWEITPDGPRLASSEFAWAQGAPQWPRDAADAARAACEAAILGLNAEAEAYITAQLRGTGVLSRICSGAEACVPLNYAPPDARRAVGLLRRESPRCGRVDPVYYNAFPDGGVQGPWVVEVLPE
jgi:hypothetical protein